MSAAFGFLVVAVCVMVTLAHPTMYKLNNNQKLEPDLIPVSSTVIPLPVYQVTHGLQVVSHKNAEKVEKPQGPVTLITVQNKKKPSSPTKAKQSDVSKVKEISKQEFDN